MEKGKGYRCKYHNIGIYENLMQQSSNLYNKVAGCLSVCFFVCLYRRISLTAERVFLNSGASYRSREVFKIFWGWYLNPLDKKCPVPIFLKLKLKMGCGDFSPLTLITPRGF